MALQNFSEVAYQAACGETEFHLASGGWVMDIITQPSLTVKVQTAEPKLRTALLGVLRTLGFRVKEKDDHLVVSLT
ncbi:MAG: hypothetical protein ABIQ04_04940 [Candidatus Saccharimonadales bacterium]